MFNGDFIVKQSKFLLFVTILYLKDCSHAHNNQLFNFDFDLISDILSLTEDLMSLSRSYGDYETAKYFLPQHKWIIRNEDVHLNYSQLIKKYGLSEESQSEENDDAITLKLLKIPNDNLRDGNMNTFYNGQGCVVRVMEDSIAYHLASNEYEEWIGRASLNRKDHHSPSSSDLLNFRRDKFGDFDIPEIFGIVYHFTKIGSELYVGRIDDTNSFFVFNSQNSRYNTKITLTVALSIIVWLLRFISVITKIIVKLNKNMYLFVQILGCDNIFTLKSNNDIVYLMRTVLCYHLPLTIIVCINSKLDFNRSEIKKPLALPYVPQESIVKKFINYIKLLMYNIFEKNWVNKENEERSLVLYKPKERVATFDKRINVLPIIQYDDNLYAKLLIVINFCWVRLTRYNFLLEINNLKNVILYKISSLLNKAVQVLLLIEKINYVTIAT